MHQLPLATSARLSRAILVACLTATAALALCQSASPAAPGQSQPAANPNPPNSPNSNDEMLARAGSLYYSTAKSGLVSFDCAVHPDWHSLIVSANAGSAIAENDPRIVLLKTVNIEWHGRLKGGSTLDWNPAASADKPLDQDSTTLLKGAHDIIENALQSFMQFWTPFVDGTAVPANSKGQEITKTENGYTLHATSDETTLTEQLDNQLTLTHINTVTTQNTVNFEPAYKSTDQGMLVNRIIVHILPAGDPPGKAEEMRVAIEYQPVQGFPILAQLNISVLGRGTFNFALDGCTVNAGSK